MSLHGCCTRSFAMWHRAVLFCERVRFCTSFRRFIHLSVSKLHLWKLLLHFGIKMEVGIDIKSNLVKFRFTASLTSSVWIMYELKSTKAVLACPWICLKGLRGITKIAVRSPGRDTNQEKNCEIRTSLRGTIFDLSICPPILHLSTAVWRFILPLPPNKRTLVSTREGFLP
jgi:hypothetical protein